MNLMLYILFLVLFLHESYGVIYNLNASEYERMPPIYKLDSYSSCLQEPSDVFCTLNFQLVSDEPNELLHMIEEYSEHSKTHFNHTKLRYAICVTKSCQNYIQNKSSVSKTILERCLNQSFWENYQLKTRIQHYSCYSLSDNEVKIDAGDVMTGIILFAIIALNIIGTFYDMWCTSNKQESKHVLLIFSLKQNWKRLILTTPNNDPRSERLKGIKGFKCILAYGVIYVHTLFPFFNMVENVHELELSYHNVIQTFIINSPLMLQSSFVISAFLMTYNMELISEKHPINWGIVPKGILHRFIRLTPVYALVILILATWYKFFVPGPLWEMIGQEEMLDCRKYWWINILYLNNYMYNFRCSPPSWHLAADMQLFCCGLILYVLLRNSTHKKAILISLIVVGSIIPGIHTYVRDLDFGLHVTPSAASVLFMDSPTFNATYRTAHGNISSYVIGMCLGYFVYKWQQKEIDYRKYWFIRYMYWSIVPLISGVLFSGAIFYKDGPREPLYMRVLFSTFAKPILATLVAIMAVGVFKLENICRKIFEWDLWIIPSRLCYIVYLINFPYITIYMNMRTSLLQLTLYNVFILSIYLTIVCFVTAIPVYLLVEAPFTELSKYFIESRKREVVMDDKYHKKTE